MAGGTMAMVVGLGAGVASASTGSPATEGSTGGPASAPHGPTQGIRPTVGGRISAITGDDLTVRGPTGATTTVVVSASTTITKVTGSGVSSRASTSALAVGDFVGVRGTKESNGTVEATHIVISTGPPGRGIPGGAPGRGSGTPPAAA